MEIPQKKKIIFLCVSILIAALVLIFWLGMLLGSRRTAGNLASIPQETLLLKAFDGKVALYIPPYEKPQTVYDIYLSTLPTLDQTRLQKGIYLEDENELRLYLEDFDS